MTIMHSISAAVLCRQRLSSGRRGQGQGSESPHLLPNQPLRDQPGFLNTEPKGHLLVHLSAHVTSATSAVAKKMCYKARAAQMSKEGQASLCDAETAGPRPLQWSPMEENMRRQVRDLRVHPRTRVLSVERF